MTAAASGQRYTHGWVPIGVASGASRAASIKVTADVAKGVNSPFAQGAAHHLNVAAGHVAAGRHDQAQQELDAAHQAAAAGTHVVGIDWDGIRTLRLKDLARDVGILRDQNAKAAEAAAGAGASTRADAFIRSGGKTSPSPVTVAGHVKAALDAIRSGDRETAIYHLSQAMRKSSGAERTALKTHRDELARHVMGNAST